MAGIIPTNLSRKQIYVLAELFAEKTSYIPGITEIIDYVKEKLHGNIVYSDNPKDSVGGSISVNSRDDFTIYLSKATSRKRDVFTIAHELGHYFLHSRLGEVQLKASRSEDIDEAEKEANSFAAAFLMPEDRVRKLFSEKDGNISALADAFKVSLTAMNWRCINLGLKKA
ncbi:MAG: ImmA/IrrE family metallo-endopeptidase [Treponema sp.]|nr:ImmA/IrrE family metallo-endopeptidase [Treponema sp.]